MLSCHEAVAFYASSLSITTTYLYKLCRKHLQMSPKEVLDRQTVTEIKTCLVNTDVPIKVIAGEMHSVFLLPVLFCKFAGFSRRGACCIDSKETGFVGHCRGINAGMSFIESRTLATDLD